MMFSVHRNELLNIAEFQPYPNDCLQVLETRKYAGESECEKHNWRQLKILDCQVEDWLAQKGRFKFPDALTKDAVLEGGIRLIFCERSKYRPPGFSMSQKSFLAVEEAFDLPKATLYEAFQGNGMFSKHLEYRLNDSDSLEKIGIIIKVPQKKLVANYLVSLSHNLATGFTTAFIFGTDIHTPLAMLNKLILSGPLSPTDESQYQGLTRTAVAQSTEIISRLGASPHLWASPFLLPTIVLETYILRTDLFAWSLDDRVVALERQTGVVFAGRDIRVEERNIKSTNISKETIERLTKDMHTLHTQIIFYQRIAEWSVDCGNFLEEWGMAFKESSGFKTRGHVWRRSFMQLMENIEFLQTTSRMMCAQQKGLNQRIQSQIDVLYSFIAQIDNSLNAKIAVSSARDSSAMKTLALITTIFLPGTYVATLFSMSMFSWNSPNSSLALGSQKGEEATVSHHIWIYWAITIPLTLVVMIIWRVWWLYQARINRNADDEAVEKIGQEESRRQYYRSYVSHPSRFWKALAC